jgi:hypothetical protein
MKNKDINNIEAVKDFPKIIFDPNTTVKLNDTKLNSFGLDLTNPDFIKYQSQNLEAEVIGGVNTIVLTRFQVMLKLSRRPQMSAQDVYRNNVDLYNENNLDHFIKQASLKLKVDKTQIADFVYDLVERLEDYRKDKRTYKDETPVISPLATKEQKKIKAVLESDALLEEIQELLEISGVPCSKTGLQLFLIALSSKTSNPIHGILQGETQLTNAIIQSFEKVIPFEVNRYKTSISDSVLYYAPSENYWKNKVLLLPTIDTLGKNNTALTELITQKAVKRLVTENTEQGTYRASSKSINGNLSFISSTVKGYHELLKSDTVISLTICSPKQIKDAIATNQIKQFAGLLNEQEQQTVQRQLQEIFRAINTLKVVNPLLEQIDVAKYFSNDAKLISQFLKVTSLITLLYQKQLEMLQKNEIYQIEVEPKHMLAALELFQEVWFKQEQELPFNVACTLTKIKRELQKQNPTDFEQIEFTVKQMRAKLKVSPSSFARHITTLYDYNKLERTNGNKKDGFSYRVIAWDTSDVAEQYENFKNEIQSV